MRKLALLSVLALLASISALVPAGAEVSSGSSKSDTKEARSAADMTFGAPVMVSANDDQTAAEPSIRGARDGSIYIVAPTGLGNVRTGNESGGGDVVWRSDDFGKT